MTDDEIKKALECCGILGAYVCDEKCPMFNNGIKNISVCRRELICSAITLINRHQAEIEQWKEEANRYQNLCCVSEEDAVKAKSEAVKEFAERLKMNITINNTSDGYLDCAVDYNCLIEDIDDLVEEMVGDME